MTPEELLDVIRRRRTITPDQFDDNKPVDRRIIEDILMSANWAPTYDHTEPWRFVVFQGEGKRRLSEVRAVYPEVKDEPGAVADEATELVSQSDAEAAERLQDLVQEADRCSHIISLGMKRHPEVPEITEIMGTACAIQNMLLTASSYGLGVKWSFGGREYSDELRAFLRLDVQDSLFGYLLIGYPNIQWPTGQRNTSIDEKVKWVVG